MVNCFASSEGTPPFMAQEYLNVMTTYGIYAKSLWHDAEPGGYWGDGIEAKNQNGGVRGMSNTLLTYAMLIRGLDEGWIAPEDRKLLEQAGLTRAELLRYARAEIDYLIAHHKSAPVALQPQWGFWWQSSLWMGASGPAVLLLWNDLSEEQRSGFTRVAAAEADRIVSMPPKDYLPGDTGAEENGWNTAAPAVALAIAPNDPRAEKWWRALRVYAVNTYSVPADRTSTATVGEDRIADLVSTANLFPDWTLFNHRFFHPDYVQVSAQHLGEAGMILALGDRMHKTNFAERYRPYGLHHVRDVWENVARPLLLPSGEFAFPNGNDWTFHCSTIQSYLAYIATALDDPYALSCEREGIKHVQRRRAVSPPGRLLGDSNLEWWWEPLVCKRAATALLQHEVAGPTQQVGRTFLSGHMDATGTDKPAARTALATPKNEADASSKSVGQTFLSVSNSATSPDQRSTTQTTPVAEVTQLFPDSKVWIHRNANYICTVGWGSKHMAQVIPLRSTQERSIYMILPEINGLICDQLNSATVTAAYDPTNTAKFPAVFLESAKEERCAIVCLQNSVVFLNNFHNGPIAIENDLLTTPGRKLTSVKGEQLVPPTSHSTDITIPGNWLNIDDTYGFLTPNEIYYSPWTAHLGKSVQADLVQPEAGINVLQLLPGATTSETQAVLSTFHAEKSPLTVRTQDGQGAAKLHITFDAGTSVPVNSRIKVETE